MREGRTAEASAARKEIAQLQSALAAEMFAKDAATARSKEVEQLLSAEMATRAAADGKVSALEKEVAVVQRELEDARKAAERTRSESTLLSEALEKARAQGITLAQERDALASEVESLERQRKELEEQLATAREQEAVTAREVKVTHKGLKGAAACLEESENPQQKTLAELDMVAMKSTVANSAAAAAVENARLERQVEKWTKFALNPKPRP